MNANINEAANLIAEFNPTLAAMFISRPFQRRNIADAFEAGFTTHSDYSRKVCALVIVTAKLDATERAIAAQAN